MKYLSHEISGLIFDIAIWSLSLSLTSNMTASIISRGADALISPGRRNIAIAEIVLFSIIHLVQVPLRYMQEWRYWHHNKRQSPARCYFYSWWSMVGILAQGKSTVPAERLEKGKKLNKSITVRIASSAMMLSTSNPNTSMLIAESAMQNAGLSPLLFEVSLVLLAWYDLSATTQVFFFFGKANHLLSHIVGNQENSDPENRNIQSH